MFVPFDLRSYSATTFSCCSAFIDESVAEHTSKLGKVGWSLWNTMGRNRLQQFQSDSPVSLSSEQSFVSIITILHMISGDCQTWALKNPSLNLFFGFCYLNSLLDFCIFQETVNHGHQRYTEWWHRAAWWTEDLVSSLSNSSIGSLSSLPDSR